MTKSRTFSETSPFLWILFSSLILHLLILSIINIHSPEKQLEKIFEVEFSKIVIPKKYLKKHVKPQPVKKNSLVIPHKPTVTGIKKNERKIKKDVVNYHRITKQSLSRLNKPLPVIKPVSKPQLAAPLPQDIDPLLMEGSNDGIIDEKVNLPESKIKKTDIKIKPHKIKAASLQSGVQSGEVSTGKVKSDIAVGEIKQTGEKFRITEKEVPTVKPQVLTNLKSFNDLKIEGEVSNRRIIFHPPPPNLNIDKDLTILLKFSVLPSGVVDQVIPYKKADPDLEKLATDLLLRYRFEPLTGEKRVQYGIIHFTIKRSN